MLPLIMAGISMLEGQKKAEEAKKQAAADRAMGGLGGMPKEQQGGGGLGALTGVLGGLTSGGKSEGSATQPSANAALDDIGITGKATPEEDDFLSSILGSGYGGY